MMRRYLSNIVNLKCYTFSADLSQSFTMNIFAHIQYIFTIMGLTFENNQTNYIGNFFNSFRFSFRSLCIHPV